MQGEEREANLSRDGNKRLMARLKRVGERAARGTKAVEKRAAEGSVQPLGRGYAVLKEAK